jgi:inner membrane protein
MLARTHIAVAFLFSLFVFPFLDISWFIFFPFVFLGSILPDIDHKKSKVNKSLYLTRFFSFFFRHRGFFHSIFPVFFLLLLEFFLNSDGIFFSLSFGYFLHLFCDSLTLSGVVLFYPFSNFRIKGFIKTGSILECFIFILAVFFSFLKIFFIFL